MSMARRFGLVVLALMLALTAGLAATGLPVGWAWLLAANGVAFLTYGYDKWISGTARMRVPEIVLLGAALGGGTLGAFVGMRVFHHKTAKAGFQARFGWIVAGQALVLGAAGLFLLVKQ